LPADEASILVQTGPAVSLRLAFESWDPNTQPCASQGAYVISSPFVVLKVALVQNENESGNQTW
jgi:hypothetical protein